MDHIHRVTRAVGFFALGVVLSVFAVSAFAIPDGATMTDGQVIVEGNTTYWRTGSAAHGCTAYPAGWGVAGGYWWAPNLLPCQMAVLLSKVDACPAGQTWDNATRACKAPPDPCAADAGKYFNPWIGGPWTSTRPTSGDWFSGTGEVPDTGCENGCKVTYDWVDAIRFPSSNTWGGTGRAVNTGVSCTVATPPQGDTTSDGPKDPATTPEYDCAKNGQGWGTVNGTVVCTGPASDSTSTKTETTKTTNPDNTSSETTTQTECSGNTCTTTKTTCTKDAAGNSTGCETTSTTSTGPDTGSDNPDGGAGGEGQGDGPESKWGGNCTAGFACSGDAIQCAIAKEQHIRNCQLEPTQAHKDKGQNVIDGVLEANDPRRPENKGSEAFGNWSSEGGMTGSCPADFSVDLYGQTIVVPWSDLCPHFNAMGYAMLAVAWVIAASVLRGVL